MATIDGTITIQIGRAKVEFDLEAIYHYIPAEPQAMRAGGAPYSPPQPAEARIVDFLIRDQSVPRGTAPDHWHRMRRPYLNALGQLLYRAVIKADMTRFEDEILRDRGMG